MQKVPPLTSKNDGCERRQGKYDIAHPAIASASFHRKQELSASDF